MEKSVNPLYPSIRQSCLAVNIIHDDSESLELNAEFIFGAAFTGFRGHFPGRPVLPAVVQLASVRFLAETGLKQPVYPVSYSRTKFRGIIQPDEKIILQVRLKREDVGWTGTFTVDKDEGERVTSGAFLFSTVNRGE